MRLLIASLVLIAASSVISEDAIGNLLQNVSQDLVTTVIRKIFS